MIFKTFEQFISENYNPILESNNTGKAERAAEVIMKFINKKTGKDYKKFPFADSFTIDSKKFVGIKYFSDKDGTCLRINNSNSSIGLIDSIDIWTKSINLDIPDFTISSPNIPLTNLVNDIVNFLKNPKEINKAIELTESITEAVKLTLDHKQVRNVQKMLNAGKTAKQASEALGIAYKQILAVKKGQKSQVDKSSTEAQNEMTLQDKVLYHQTLMEDVYDITSAIAQKKFNSLMITGRAGTGKTFNVEKALNENGMRQDIDFFKITGSISTVEMFKKLFQFKDKILIFDDADSVFGSEDGRNILKAALDSKEVRQISYFKKLKFLYDPKDFENNPEGEVDALDNGLVPQTFEFRGRVIFISNLEKSKADPDGAIRSRSILIDVNPDDETLVGVMEKLLPHLEPKQMSTEEKKEVFEFVKNAGDISMRTFVKAAGFKVAGMKNWKRMADRYI